MIIMKFRIILENENEVTSLYCTIRGPDYTSCRRQLKKFCKEAMMEQEMQIKQVDCIP